MKRHRYLFATRSIVFLLALLTSATTWAFKTEKPESYTLTRTAGSIFSATAKIMCGDDVISSWNITGPINYKWKANGVQTLKNGMTIKPSHDIRQFGIRIAKTA